MKRVLVGLFIMLFLVGFVFADNNNGMNGDSDDENEYGSDNDYGERNGYNEDYGSEMGIKERERIQAKNLSQEELQEIKQERNRLRILNETGECANDCVCDGSTIKCNLNGSREMTVRAGNSGNVIFQVKGQNASTKVELYNQNGKLYGVFNGNKTRAINVLPDEVQERVRNQLRLNISNEDIELNEDGNYEVQAEKRARLFGLFSVKEKVQAQVNSETGEVVRVRNSWWGFLASDVDEE